jgi:glycosyltransferase involved in cell wall biosynthesis
MKVAIITDSVYDHLYESRTGRGDGQAATWLVQVALEFLAQHEMEITWLSLKRGLKRPRRNTVGIHEFIELPQIPPSVDSHLNYSISRFQLMRELRRIQPDVVHTWGTERPYPAILKGLKIPNVLSINGALVAYAKLGALPEGSYWKRQANYEKKWLPHATLVTTESDWASSRLEPYPSEARIREIVYGVNPSFYKIPWLPDPEMPSLVCVGTICKGKGSDVLIEAFRSLAGSNLCLHMVGHGNLFERLKALETPGVIWHGQVGWQKLQEILSSSWAMVHPTIADSNPNAVKEARVVGLPIITTRHGGQTEYLVAEGNSIVVEPLNSPALADAISRMTASFENCLEFGKFNHLVDRERFLPKHTALAFISAYKEASAMYPESMRPKNR